MKKLFLLFSLLLTTLVASAYDFSAEYNGVTIYYDKSGNKVSVTSRDSNYNSYSGDVEIPSTVEYNGTTYTVASIGNYAFQNCSSLTSVTIPESVTSIGNYAFYGCSSLTSVTIPNSVTSINGYAFQNCRSMTSVTIPNSVTSIGYNAFDGCTSLTGVYISDIAAWCNIDFGNSSSNPFCYAKNLYQNGVLVTDLSIPESVTSIKKYAFDGCSMTSVTIPNSVTSIGSYAFSRCSSLTSVTIPESVTSISSYAFFYCRSLTSVTIPNSVTSIGSYAFQSCSSLTGVTIPNSVTSIGDSAFYGCSSLTSVNIPNSVTTIGNYAFYGCSSMTSVTIPNSVTSIGSDAFYNCSSLTSVTIPNSVTSIGLYAFYGCSSLTSVTIPESVTSIGSSTFYGCSSLTSVTIPNSVTSIGSSAFYGCSSLTSVTIPNSVTSIGSDAFRGCSSLTSVNIPNSVTTIGNYAFYGCSSLTSVTIPNSVTSIGNDAFSGCSSLTSVTIPESVTSIGSSAFSGCSSLTSVTIPNSVTSINGYAFYGCSSLTSVTIPNSVTSINGYAFYNCSSMTSVTIPNSVTSINGYAFYGCTSLTGVYISDIAAWCNIDFGNSSSNPFCYAKNLYQNGVLVTDLSIPESVTSIKNYAFFYCRSLTSVTIPNSVTSIGYGAFYGCSSLTSVTIGNSVTSIGNEAFSNINAIFNFNHFVDCDYCFGNYAVITVPSNLISQYKDLWPGHASQILSNEIPTGYTIESIARDNSSDVMDMINCEAGVFDAMLNVVDLKVSGTINSFDIMTMRNKMVNLKYLDLTDARIVYNSYEYYTGNHSEDDVLGDNAFRNCENLVSIKLPESIKTIGSYAFSGCSNLTEAVFNGDLETIGSYAFSGCSNLTEAVFNGDLETIGSYAFRGCSNLKDIQLPQGLKQIGYEAFRNCSNLEKVVFNPNLVKIEGYAFEYCNKLKELQLPPSLERIDGGAFYGCSGLTEVRIPEKISYLADNAFSGCGNIRDIYTWTIQPTNIGQDTFSSSLFTTALLHVPNTAKKLYYWDTQWSQFLNATEFNEPYTYFYLSSKDLEIDEETVRLEGNDDDNPDADIYGTGGLIVKGDESQNLGEVNLSGDGNGNSGSIVGNNSSTETSGANVNIDDLKITIDIKSGKWYFFSFPFEIPYGNIHFNGQFVWRYYDGEYRAEHGSGAWKNVEGSLKANRGYIFQASKNGTLTLNVGRASIGGDDKLIALEEYPTQNAQDAGWNLIGNPFTSYYELSDIGFVAPVTIWNGSNYEALSPIDDEYTMYPFQAFFVQSPGENENVAFEAENRETKNQSVERNNRQNITQRRLARANTAEERKLINLVMTDGAGNTDKTRVVFNEAKSAGYDIECDASKFISNDVAQIYSLDIQNVMYAINERPENDGIVKLGIKIVADGTYTISTTRMDCDMELVDLKTGDVSALTGEGYTFTAQAGTDNDRFILRKSGTSGIGAFENDGTDSLYFGLDGIYHGNKQPAGVSVEKKGNAYKKVINR